jgi:two-component system LytT family sensor kinase
MRIKRKAILYWWCQLGGWLLYGLTMVFFAFVFDSKINSIFYPKLLVIIISGLFFTHVLRELIKLFNLLPPELSKKRVQFTGVLMLILVLFNLTNSAIAEWLHLYNPKTKVSVDKRFLVNLVSDSPLILVWVSIYYLWHYIELGTKTEFQKIKLESLVKEMELKTIKSHINPHFIFNALNSIRALVDENPVRARTAITELSNLLRSSMQAEKQETVPFERELNIVKDYLALEHIRFEDRLNVEYDIDEDTLDQPIPPMMLQTLVENAIKHGISKSKEGGTIKIISDFRQSHHELIVQNSGTIAEIPDAEGFGLNSTRSRLKLLFGNKASFTIEAAMNNIVEAKIIMPVQAVPA